MSQAFKPESPASVQSARQLGLRWLVGVTLLCLGLVFGLRGFFNDLNDELRARGANERARLFVGEEIVRGIQGMEKDIYRLAATQSASGFAYVTKDIDSALGKLQHDLRVLQNGGTARRQLRLNIGGLDELVREATYQPTGKGTEPVMEVIEILPQLDHIRSSVDALQRLLAQRWQATGEEDRKRFFQVEEEIALLLKQVPPYFERLDENANRLFLEGDQRLRELETQLQNQRQRLQLMETALIALVIFFGGISGTLLMRRLAKALADARQARVEVEGQRAQSATMLDTLSDGVYATDMQGYITFMNPAAERILGWKAQDLVGQQAHDAVHHSRPSGQVYPQAQCPLIAVLHDGSSCNGEEHFVARDGRFIPVSYRSKPLLRDGQIVGSLLSFQDISERHESEARIRLQQAALDAAANMVVITDRNGVMEYVNPAFCRTTGFDLADVLGKNISLLNAGVHEADFFHAMWATVLQGKPWEGELHNRRKDGTVYLEQMTITPITDDGVITHFISIKRDISEEERTRTRLKLVEAAIQETEQGILITDATVLAQGLTIQYVNAGFSRMTGYSSEEAVGKATDILLGLDTSSMQQARFLQAVAQGSGVVMEMNLQRKNGQDCVAEMHCSPVHDDQGKLRHYIGLLSDIGPRKQAELAMRQARDQALETSRLKSEFLSTMSHEIRTPMNGIIGMTDLLLDTSLTPEQSEFAGIVRDSSKALLTIINDILDFSKIEAGKLEIEVTDFSPTQAVEGTVELLATKAREKGLRLSSFCDPALPTLLRGDPNRLRQVLLNLIGNAVKFTERGSVEVSTTQTAGAAGPMLRFEISDTGIGISPQTQARLFQSFTQADSSTTRKYGGTGLGLAISKRLVELMGGEIGVHSEQDQGSTFWFTLPLLAAETNSTPERQVAQAGSLRNMRVLVVDDQASDRQIVHRFLASWGLVSDGASNATEALKLMRDAAELGHGYDLALIDYSMPGMDGIELAQTLRSEGGAQSTRLVLLSAHDRSEVFESALAAGFCACLAKPVRQSMLFDTLMHALPQPLADGRDEGPGFRPHSPALSLASAPRRLILLAEDNPTNQRLAQLQLGKMGYDVHTVGNGQEAVDALTSEPKRDYSLILMDCQMPVMDGFAATAAIRQIELARHIPIVAMTANAMQGDRERCMAAGMDDYISKPIQPELFRQVLLKWHPLAPAAAPLAVFPAQNLAPPSFASEPTLIDFSRLDDYFGDEPEVISSLLEMFCTSTGPLLEQLGAAIESHDPDRATALAHEVKGTCGNLGVDSMAHLAREIETLVAAGDWPVAAQRLEAARQVFARVLVLIRDHGSV